MLYWISPRCFFRDFVAVRDGCYLYQVSVNPSRWLRYHWGRPCHIIPKANGLREKLCFYWKVSNKAVWCSRWLQFSTSASRESLGCLTSSGLKFFSYFVVETWKIDPFWKTFSIGSERASILTCSTMVDILGKFLDCFWHTCFESLQGILM